MSEIERLLQQQLNALQQQRANEISALERQLNALLQQQKLQQQQLASLNATVAEQAQRSNALYSAFTEHDRLLKSFQTVLMGALESSGSLDVEQLYQEISNDARQELEEHLSKTDKALLSLEHGLSELQNSVNELLAQLPH